MLRSIVSYIPGAQKKYSLKNLGNFATNIESYYVKFYTVSRLLNDNNGKFYCIDHRANKITLPFVMETWQS